MADVTRAEFDSLVVRVSALEAKTPVPVTPPTPPAPAVPITMSVPTVKVVGATYTLTGSVTVTKAVSFTYLQMAVRGFGAVDLAHLPATKLAAGASIQLSGSAQGSGDYMAWVAYSLDAKTWVDGPKTAFSVVGDPVVVPTPPAPPPAPSPTPAGGQSIALVGRSKLPFNSIVFRQNPQDADAFGSRRGVPVDGFLWFTTRRSWDDFRQLNGSGHSDWLNSGRLMVTSMPHAPESEGSGMNSKGANDGYRDAQRAHGKWLADAGLNHPSHVIRVDWECNGNWYNWSANRSGADALRAAIKYFVINVRAGGATKVKFDLCFNKGPSQSGADFSVFPGAEYVDIVAVDQYDMWAPAYSDSDWAREVGKSPSMQLVADFAKSHGIMWALDEGGNTHGDFNQGGDNPTYWQLVHKQILKELDTCAWHNTYDDQGAPATLHHDFASNPKSWEMYQKLWTP